MRPFYLCFVVALCGCGSRTGIDLLGDSPGPAPQGEVDVPLCSTQGLSTLTTRPQLTQFTGSIAVDATSVYWAELPQTFDGPGQVVRMPKCGGPVTVLASTPGGPASVAVDDTSVYWTNQSSGGSGSVMRVPSGGGEAVVVASGGNPTGLALFGNDVYWTDLDTGVMRVSKDGGAPLPVGGPQLVWVDISVVSSYVVLTDSSMTGHQLIALPMGGGPARTLATDDGGLTGGLALDDEAAYWAEYGPGYGAMASIVRIPLAGGEAVPLGTGYPTAMLVDGNNLYWSEYPNENNTGRIVRTPKSGGALTTIASGLDDPRTIAVDGERVYWLEDVSVKSAPK